TAPAIPDPAAVLARALDMALARRPFPPVHDAVVVVSDGTRAVPNGTILPPLLSRMEAAGIPREGITILVGTGLHRPTREAELPALLGPEICARYRVAVHDARDREQLAYLGQTSRGTPIWINRSYVNSRLRVLTGMIEPHQFVGFTGGAKSVAIGLAGAETIAGNHALLQDPRSQIGVYAGNPAREEMEEILESVGADLAVNVILNNDKEIVELLAGPAREVQRTGVVHSAELCQVPLHHPFDIVIASPGGFPKDREMYQAQKAVAHAALAVREGGTIILVAECPEGSGEDRFEEWMSAASDPSDVLERFRREGFQTGAHKAFLLCRSMVRAKLLLVSDRMPADLARRLLLELHRTPESALAAALAYHGENASIAVMPKASSTIPRQELW
ncbi:MAG TPA: nickel-dependent lactate racemase, partial [Chloroflexota bacterium]|nr:nickel-dependent lactate racemase [Chloroflexota bacterium]